MATGTRLDQLELGRLEVSDGLGTNLNGVWS